MIFPKYNYSRRAVEITQTSAIEIQSSVNGTHMRFFMGKGYFPQTDAKFDEWFENFANKLPAIAQTIG